MTQNTADNAPAREKYHFNPAGDTITSARRQNNLIDADARQAERDPSPKKITHSLTRNRVCSALLACYTEADSAEEFASLIYGAQIVISMLPQFDKQDELTFNELASAICKQLFNADGSKAC